jgi:hypothetical protein
MEKAESFKMLVRSYKQDSLTPTKTVWDLLERILIHMGK